MVNELILLHVTEPLQQNPLENQTTKFVNGGLKFWHLNVTTNGHALIANLSRQHTHGRFWNVNYIRVRHDHCWASRSEHSRERYCQDSDEPDACKNRTCVKQVVKGQKYAPLRIIPSFPCKFWQPVARVRALNHFTALRLGSCRWRSIRLEQICID